MGSWYYLCRKHFDQEKEKLRKKKYWWSSAGWVEPDDVCDYGECRNKPYREIYTPLPIKDYPRWFITLMKRIDFRYWNCKNCGWDYRFGRLFDWDCPKHGMKSVMKDE